MNDRMGLRADRLRATYEVLRAPNVRLFLGDGAGAKRIRDSYSGPHPRLRVVPYKRWGVALLDVPEHEGDYLRGRSRQVVRSNRNRALREGYAARTFDGSARIDEVMAIHRSAPVRQGRSIATTYTETDAVARFCRNAGELWGVFDREDTLAAYAHLPIYGDVAIFNRLMGHAASLRDGTMYLLVSECVLALGRQRGASGRPAWAMYDTFWGAKPGLAYFKRRLGFAPYRVEWRCGSA